jgi:uncharacterized membrane protein YjjB (DUF3815 family)
MNLFALVAVGGWAALFAAAMSIIFAAPSRALLPSFFAGFIARVSRDALIAAGADASLATLIAAALVGLVGEALVRRHIGSPVVVVSALVPLGAALPLFRVIVDFLRIPSMAAAKLAVLPQAMLSDLSKVFTTTAAIGLGVFLATYAGRFMRRETAQ